MTDIKVTQADIDTVRQIRLSDQVWYQQDRIARHRIEAQRPLLEALEKALHILQYCPDKQKKAEALIEAAIKQAKGE